MSQICSAGNMLSQPSCSVNALHCLGWVYGSQPYNLHSHVKGVTN